MTKPKKAIIWGRADVLGDAFESFFASRGNWDVVRIMSDEPTGAFIQRVDKEAPDVIILYEGDYTDLAPLSAQLMRDRPRLRVITASLQDNNLEVYDKHKVCVKNMADLFSAIEG